MNLPFWVWYVTATAGLGSIAISAFVVVFMKYAEVEARERKETQSRSSR